jgi:hypothetical protein
VLGLSSLAGWEEAVLASIRGARGTPEERDRQIERSGLYGEYPAIVRGYLELFGVEEAAVEASKRALFLVWRGAMAPPSDTGIAPLPDGVSREVIGELDARARRGAADDELAWMLAWYAGESRFVFDVYGATSALFDLAASLPIDAWRSRRITAASMQQRGQLGHYWLSLAGTR